MVKYSSHIGSGVMYGVVASFSHMIPFMKHFRWRAIIYHTKTKTNIKTTTVDTKK